MNRDHAIFQLDELRVHIQDVIAEIEAGDYDEDGKLSYEVAIGHLMDHLVNAWHYAHLSDKQIDEMTQDQFEYICSSIPKFQYGYRLVEPYEPVV